MDREEYKQGMIEKLKKLDGEAKGFSSLIKGSSKLSKEDSLSFLFFLTEYNKVYGSMELYNKIYGEDEEIPLLMEEIKEPLRIYMETGAKLIDGPGGIIVK